MLFRSLHNGSTSTVSAYGLMFPAGQRGFLYTALGTNSKLKYSGGVGTFVTYDKENTGSSNTYWNNGGNLPDKVPQVQPSDQVPATATFDFAGLVVDKSSNAVANAAVTFTYKDKTYTRTTDASGYFTVNDMTEDTNTTTYTATVQKGAAKTTTYNGTGLTFSGVVKLDRKSVV